MDKIKKALEKLGPDERKKIKDILQLLQKLKTNSLDIKKFKGRNDIFRARKGRIRIIYRIDGKGIIFILTIGRISDKIYKRI